VGAALGLFARHGVNGTSLQMIADAIGVTKAAVYHQFKTKEEIVLAAVEVELARFEPALTAAESDGHSAQAVKSLLTQVIDLAVERRRMVVALLYDPVVIPLLAEQEPLQLFIQRLFRIVMGPRRGADAQVRTAMVLTAIGGAVTHPLVADLDDGTLRAHLLDLTWTFLDLPLTAE
jgi:AcrR family transcriptional regulator